MNARPTERFSNRVADYVRYRPRYPTGVLDVLREGIGLQPDWTIADIGSGTGFSAEMFLDQGNTVFGVEPNAAMRRAAEQLLADRRNFRSIAGTAEATTLPAASIDLVVAGQAFHWFDAAAARTEFLRILRGEPWVALLWNTRRTAGSPFLRAYEDVLLACGTDYTAVSHERLDAAALGRFFGGRFERRTLENAQSLDLPALRGRLLSTSYVPAANDPASSAMLALLDDVFDALARDGVVRLEYDVEIVVGILPDTAR